MIFVATPLKGAYVVELDRHADERGFFARTWCADEFREHGLEPRLAQCSISFNKLRGTLRGMHFQAPPYAEAKLVRCTQGAAYDVIVDLREGSPTRLRWFGTELSADNYWALYVPQGFAHGFQTLLDDTELLYQISESYHPEAARGVRWDDPAVGIHWPVPNPLMSDTDRSFRLYGEEPAGG